MIISKSNHGWELNKIANGHLSCDNFNLTSDDIDTVEQMLKPKFEYAMQKNHITVSYDNWSGLFIMQMPGFETKHDGFLHKLLGIFVKQTPRVKNDSADAVIKEIYDFLSTADFR